ncbi:hypothetical protein J6590_062711 [Homalodisca vitripennis]|nr:hypothetical protein J6590_062711 [Homalodisca vitripennis]
MIPVLGVTAVRTALATIYLEPSPGKVMTVVTFRFANKTVIKWTSTKWSDILDLFVYVNYNSLQRPTARLWALERVAVVVNMSCLLIKPKSVKNIGSSALNRTFTRTKGGRGEIRKRTATSSTIKQICIMSSATISGDAGVDWQEYLTNPALLPRTRPLITTPKFCYFSKMPAQNGNLMRQTRHLNVYGFDFGTRCNRLPTVFEFKQYGPVRVVIR